MSDPDRPIEEDDLHAFIDGELAPERVQAVERYLQARPEEARRVAAYQAQRDELHALFTPALTERLPPRLQIAAILGRRRSRPAWQGWAVAATVVLALGLGGAGGWFLRAPPEQGRTEHALQVLIDEALTSHAVYASDSNHAIEMAGTDEPRLTQWLGNRLQRQVKAPDLSAFGYHLLGGRLLATERGSPAGLLMYSNAQGERLSLLLRPMAPDLKADDTDMLAGAAKLCAWIMRGMGYALVATSSSDLNQVADHIRNELG